MDPIQNPPPPPGMRPPRYRPLTRQPQPVQPPGPPQMGVSNLPGQTPLPIDDGPTPPKPGKPPVGAVPPTTTPIGNKPPGTQPPTPPVPPTPPTDRPRTITPRVVTPPITPETSPVGENLRSDIYLPGDDPRLQNARGATDKAASAVQGYDRSAMQSGNESRYRSIYGTGAVDPGLGVDPTESARTTRYGALQDQALDGLNGPNRTQLAQQQMDAFDAAGSQRVQDLQRQVGQKASALGRLGMGDTAVEATKPYTDYLLARDEKKAQLASQLAEGDINDRFRRLDATSGLRGQENAFDTSRRGEQRTERDYRTGLGERNQDRLYTRTNAALGYAGDQTDRSVGDLYDRSNAAGSLEDRLFNQGQSNRGEYRTERGRQDQQAQQSIENRIREMEAQAALEDQKIRRAAALQQAGGGY